MEAAHVRELTLTRSYSIPMATSPFCAASVVRQCCRPCNTGCALQLRSAGTFIGCDEIVEGEVEETEEGDGEADECEQDLGLRLAG